MVAKKHTGAYVLVAGVGRVVGGRVADRVLGVGVGAELDESGADLDTAMEGGVVKRGPHAGGVKGERNVSPRLEQQRDFVCEEAEIEEEGAGQPLVKTGQGGGANHHTT